MTEDYFIVNCPYCNESIIIYRNETNCRIFRHAVFRASGDPVNPHLSQEDCERLVASGEVYGCCKPFRLNAENVAEICDYI